MVPTLMRRLVLPVAVLLASCGGSGNDGGSDSGDTPAGTALAALAIEELPHPHARPYDRYGARTFLRNGGRMLVVAAPGDSTDPATGLPPGEGYVSWGAVHVFDRTHRGPWRRTALIRPIVGPNDAWAEDLAVSRDGRTIAVGALRDISRGSGIGSDPFDRPVRPPSGVAPPETGAVWVYAKGVTGWNLQAYVKAATASIDGFGYGVALSDDGSRMVVGGRRDRGSSDVPRLEAVLHRFTRDAAGRWSADTPTPVALPGSGSGGNFGLSVAISGDGGTVAAGAPWDMGGTCPGATYLVLDGHDAPSTVLRPGAQDCLLEAGASFFGADVSMDRAGSLLAVGAPREPGAPHRTSVTQDPDRASIGRVHLFGRSSGGWTPTAVLEASNAGVGDDFGSGVRVSADGSTVAVGAPGEAGGLSGVDPPADEGFIQSGAIYVFRRAGAASWAQVLYVKSPRPHVWGLVGDATYNGLDLDETGSQLVFGDSGSGGFTPDCAFLDVTGAVFLVRPP